VGAEGRESACEGGAGLVDSCDVGYGVGNGRGLCLYIRFLVHALVGWFGGVLTFGCNDWN
jgi:hypothetical protein